jgi:hypothetical protein
MASFTKFNCFVADVHNKVHNLGSDTLRLLLTNSAPVATNTVKANLTEITAANGYSAGGPAVTVTGSSQTSGTYSLVANDVVITASGGTIGPFRYVTLYNDTSTSDSLVGFWDYGSSITLNDTETFTWDQGASVFTTA